MSEPSRPATEVLVDCSGAPEVAQPAPATSTPSFEVCTARLREIVTALEAGDLPLERSLELFEEGVRLSRLAQGRLDAAERRVDELLGFEGGRIQTRPVDTSRIAGEAGPPSSRTEPASRSIPSR